MMSRVKKGIAFEAITHKNNSASLTDLLLRLLTGHRLLSERLAKRLLSGRSTHFIEGSWNAQLQTGLARLIIAPAKVL